jgi:hypothetical protein
MHCDTAISPKSMKVPEPSVGVRQHPDGWILKQTSISATRGVVLVAGVGSVTGTAGVQLMHLVSTHGPLAMVWSNAFTESYSMHTPLSNCTPAQLATLWQSDVQVPTVAFWMVTIEVLALPSGA